MCQNVSFQIRSIDEFLVAYFATEKSFPCVFSLVLLQVIGSGEGFFALITVEAFSLRTAHHQLYSDMYEGLELLTSHRWIMHTYNGDAQPMKCRQPYSAAYKTRDIACQVNDASNDQANIISLCYSEINCWGNHKTAGSDLEKQTQTIYQIPKIHNAEENRQCMQFLLA